MGVKIYYYVLAAVLGLGLLMRQRGRGRRAYVVSMAVLHTFVCGWRYMYLTGDLRKYAWGYYTITESGWFSADVFQNGRNFGFFWLQKLFSQLTNGDFQIFLIVLAVVTEVALAIVIYRYSPDPCLSYLLWNCFCFYVFGFSAIKQALAMALLMLAFLGIMEERPKKFLLWTVLAGCVHTPALIFLPAYWVSKARLDLRRLALYTVSAGAIFAFRVPIVTFISQFYYDETDFAVNDSVGGRFLMIVALLAVGLLLRGFRGKNFNKLFNLMAVAAVLQMFSGFDNIFTRLTDYYFQFVILYLPMMFYPEQDERVENAPRLRYLRLSAWQRVFALLCVAVMACCYYYVFNLSVTTFSETDNYLNYRFCWEVES